MYSVIAPEPKILAQLIANMAVIMKVAGVDWTMPSRRRLGQQQHGHVLGRLRDHGPGRAPALGDAPLRLKVKRVVMGECGHAYRGAVYDGPRWLGWKQPPIPMVHAVEFYYELLTQRPDQDRAEDRRAGHGPGPVQHRPRPRAAREAALRRERALRGLPRHGPALRAQLLLRGRRRGDQLRPALEAVADEEHPGQGRADRGHRRARSSSRPATTATAASRTSSGTTSWACRSRSSASCWSRRWRGRGMSATPCDTVRLSGSLLLAAPAAACCSGCRRHRRATARLLGAEVAVLGRRPAALGRLRAPAGRVRRTTAHARALRRTEGCTACHPKDARAGSRRASRRMADGDEPRRADRALPRRVHRLSRRARGRRRRRAGR